MAWLKMLDEGKVASIHDLAATVGLERKYVRAPACAPRCGSPAAKVPYELRSSAHSTLRLAFLSPRIIRAIMQGREPDGISLARLRTITTARALAGGCAVASRPSLRASPCGA